MEPINAKELFRKYADGTCSEEEKYLFEQWYAHLNTKDRQLLTEQELEETEQEILGRLLPEIHGAKRISLWPRFAAAASILLMISIGGYLLINKHPKPQLAQNSIHDILPAHNRATLTLANGQKIILTHKLSGLLATQGNMLVQISKSRAITYTASGKKVIPSEKISYNTLSTARGEQSPYPLLLPDGTKVCLNPPSSLTFPTAFNGKDRVVNMTGEAYFEVAHNAAKPFRVATKGQIIEDIGTTFNINAYNDEPVIKTTLLNGSISVSNGERKVILKPGQQSVKLSANTAMTVKEANIEEAVAWKNGLFDFDHADIKTVMRQMARWYNVDVEYEGTIPTKKLSGEMYRSVNALQAFQILNYANVKFRIENNKVIITN